MEMEEIKRNLDNVWLVCNLEEITVDDGGSEIKLVELHKENLWLELILDVHTVDKSKAMVRVAVTFNILLLERKKGFWP